MNVVFRTRIVVAALVVGLVVVWILGVIQRENLYVKRDWVTHTYEVKGQLEVVLSKLIDAEDEQRGYLLTGDPQYLNLFHQATDNIDPAVVRLRYLTKDNQEQQKTIVELCAHIAEKIAELKETIKIWRGNNLSAAVKSVNPDRQSQSIDVIRTLVAQMMETEDKLLAERKAQTKEEISKTNIAWLLLLVGAALALFITERMLERFLGELARQARLSAFVSSVNRALAESNDLKSMLAHCTNHMITHLDAAIAHIWLFDSSKKVLQLSASSSTIIRDNGNRFPLGQLESELIARNRKPHLSNKVQDESMMSDKQLAHSEGITAFAGYPLIADNEVVGVMALYARQAISTTVMQAMSAVADNIAIGVEQKTSAEALAQRETELADFRLKLNATLSSMSDGLYQIDDDGNLVYMNETAEAILGYSMAEILGQNMHHLIHHSLPDGTKRESETCQLMKVVKSGEVYFEYLDYFITKTGAFVTVEFTSSPLILNGTVTGAVVCFRDVSERQLSEKRLLLQYDIATTLNESWISSNVLERILQLVCEAAEWSMGALWMPDESKTNLKCTNLWNAERLNGSAFVSATQRMQLALGAGLPGRVWVSGDPLWVEDVTQEDYFQRSALALQDQLHGAIAFPIKVDGNITAICEFFADDVRQPDHSFLQMLAATGNQLGQFIENQIADRKLAERESLFRQMSDHVREIFWVTNYRGSEPLFVSPAFETIYGRTVESLFQNPNLFFEACHPDDRAKLANQIRLQRALPTQSEIEFRICRPDGETRWLWARMSSIVDADGTVRRLCGITSDITERKEVEKRVSEFYSTMSHELRTPLTSIRGSLGLMEGGLAGQVSDNAKHLIQVARRESDRLIRLINDILDIRKIEAGMLELKQEVVDTSMLVARTIDGIKGMAQHAKVELVSVLNYNSPVLCDADRIIQVLTNLVSNAIKYSTPESEVVIAVDSTGAETVRFSVSDNGPGIPQTPDA